MNSRNKGARGERELANKLSELGFPARRGQQFAGSPDSPDVVCDALSGFHIEAKRTERTDMYGWMRQSIEDAGDTTPLVIHRKNKEDWLVIIRLSDFLTLCK